MNYSSLPVLSEIAIFIKDIGFPVFVAVWVLMVTTKESRHLTEAINRLTSAFDRANIKINNP
ncbi:hypothetical protein MUP46_03045 [Patescibacteria group bacterium]|nr:hypothetical protein [Patescibacteria group bacterium]